MNSARTIASSCHSELICHPERTAVPASRLARWGGSEGPRVSSSIQPSLLFLIGLTLVIAAATPLIQRVLADNSAPPSITINTSEVQPRQLEDTTTQSVARVYTRAWADLDRALSRNDQSALNAAFIGFARERYATQIAKQLKAGMSVRLIARAHNASAVYYGIEGSSLEVRDDVQLERQVLTKGKVIASETKTVPFVAILSVVDDGWKVRVLEEAQN